MIWWRALSGKDSFFGRVWIQAQMVARMYSVIELRPFLISVSLTHELAGLCGKKK